MASTVIDCFEEAYLDSVIGERAVATTLVDVVALLGCRADAATIAAEGGAAALGLALVVLEDEQAVIARLELGAREGLVRRRVAPAGRVARLQADSVEGTHYLVGVAHAAAVRQRVCGEALRFLLLLHILEVIAAGITDLETLLQVEVLESMATSTSGLLLSSRKALQVRHAERADVHH